MEGAATENSQAKGGKLNRKIDNESNKSTDRGDKGNKDKEEGDKEKGNKEPEEKGKEKDEDKGQGAI
jgi:hypothetical protein